MLEGLDFAGIKESLDEMTYNAREERETLHNMLAELGIVTGCGYGQAGCRCGFEIYNPGKPVPVAWVCQGLTGSRFTFKKKID